MDCLHPSQQVCPKYSGSGEVSCFNHSNECSALASAADCPTANSVWHRRQYEALPCSAGMQLLSTTQTDVM